MRRSESRVFVRKYKALQDPTVGRRRDNKIVADVSFMEQDQAK